MKNCVTHVQYKCVEYHLSTIEMLIDWYLNLQNSMCNLVFTCSTEVSASSGLIYEIIIILFIIEV